MREAGIEQPCEDVALAVGDDNQVDVVFGNIIREIIDKITLLERHNAELRTRILLVAIFENCIVALLDFAFTLFGNRNERHFQLVLIKQPCECVKRDEVLLAHAIEEDHPFDVANVSQRYAFGD